MKNYWLVKSEPASYSWDDLVAEGKTSWTGVRNFTARNNLRSMRLGDQVLFYHSVTDKAVVGVAKVVRTAYSDPTAKEGDWSCVDLVPVKPLKNFVTLETIKADKILKDIPLIRSVIPREFSAVLVKGRGNYISLRRMEAAAGRASLLFGDEVELKQLRDIVAWSKDTGDGSLSDLGWKPGGSHRLAAKSVPWSHR